MAEQLKAIDLGGGTVWIEVGEPALVVSGDAGDLTYTAAGDAGRQFRSAELAPTLKAVMEPIRDAMGAMAGLKEVTVELSLGVKGELGFFLAKGEANAVVKVSAKWAPPASGAAPQAKS